MLRSTCLLAKYCFFAVELSYSMRLLSVDNFAMEQVRLCTNSIWRMAKTFRQI